MKETAHIPFDRLRESLANYLGRVDGEDFDILWYGFMHWMKRRQGHSGYTRLYMAYKRGWLSEKDAIAFAQYAGIALAI